MTYQTLLEVHLPKKCPKVNVKCNMKGCSQVFPRDQIRFHLFNQCDEAEVKCEVCNRKVDLKEPDNHPCIENLRYEKHKFEMMILMLSQTIAYREEEI
jgi:hypothetical protein